MVVEVVVAGRGSGGRVGVTVGPSCGRQTDGKSPFSPGTKITTQTQLNPGTCGQGLKSGSRKGVLGPPPEGGGRIGRGGKDTPPPPPLPPPPLPPLNQDALI